MEFKNQTIVDKMNVALIVAHPDDEALWAGGTILMFPHWNWFIVSLCRRTDKERATKFSKALKVFNADGIMGDLDDGPDQVPLHQNDVQDAILKLLPLKHFDLVITHNLKGEYTSHIRHEEVSRAVINLWQKGKIEAKELWTFAYEDGNKSYYPRAILVNSVVHHLTKDILNQKYNIITRTYGFGKESWEAKTTPATEAFFKFETFPEPIPILNNLL